MGQFRITITAIGPNGCDRRATPGDRLYGRCSKFTCADCITFDFFQMLRQKGFIIGEAVFTHMPGTANEVVDDLLKNERRSGKF